MATFSSCGARREFLFKQKHYEYKNPASVLLSGYLQRGRNMLSSLLAPEFRLLVCLDHLNRNPLVFLVDTLPPFSHVPVRLLPRAASEPLANYEFYNLNASNDYTNVSCCLSVFPFLNNFNALCNSFSSAILGFKLMNFSSHPPWLRWILIKSPISVCLNFIYPRLNSKTIPSLQLFLIFVVTSCLFFFSGYYIPVFVLFYAFKIFMLNNS